MDVTGWRNVAELASSQYGLVHHDQLRAHLTKSEAATRVGRHDLLPVHHRVWRLAGAPRMWRQRALGACLALGPPVAVHGFAAAYLWRLEGIAPARPDDPIEVVVPPGRSGRGRPGISVHRSPLPADDITIRAQIPVTTVSRTLADLAGMVSDTDLLSRVTDDAMRRGLLSVADLEAMRARPVRFGRERLGLVVGRRLEMAPGESVWEDEIYGWLVEAGLPPPERQVTVVLPSGEIVRLDLAYPAERVAIEFDGFVWHRDRGRFDRDRQRVSELAAAGWRVVAVTSAHQREAVVRQVRQTLEASGRAAS